MSEVEKIMELAGDCETEFSDYFNNSIPSDAIDNARNKLRAAVTALADECDGLTAARIAYASEFPADAEGHPDVGNIHANIRALKAWKTRVLDELVSYHILTAAHENDPAKALHDLLCIVQQIALDPAASSDAQKLIAAVEVDRDYWKRMAMEWRNQYFDPQKPPETSGP